MFNADQIEGLPAQFYILPDPPRDLGTVADPALETFFAATGAQIDSTEEPRAYYNIKTNRIHMQLRAPWAYLTNPCQRGSLIVSGNLKTFMRTYYSALSRNLPQVTRDTLYTGSFKPAGRECTPAG